MNKNLNSIVSAIVISLILLVLPGTTNAEPWLDSLYVRLGNAQMERTDSKAILTFEIQIKRPVEKWNNNDYSLGGSDFYLGKEGMDMSEIFSDMKVESLHEKVGTDMSKALILNSRFVLGRLHVLLTPSSTSADQLDVPFDSWVSLCKVSLTLKNTATVELGLVWDRTATGLITKKNVPILENLMDDLNKIPDKFLTFEDYATSGTFCHGEDVLLYAHAVSSGTALTCTWQQDIDGTWTDLPATLAGQPGHEGEWKDFNGFKFQLKGALGDSLILRGLTSAEGVSFKCVAQDLTLGATESETTRETPEMLIKVRPEVQVALEAYASLADFNAHLRSPNDTIDHCEGKAASVRVAFYGISNSAELSSFRGMGGKVYVEYRWWDAFGGTKRDTLKVNVSDVGNSVSPSGVLTSANVQLDLMEDGKYYIGKVWTDSCGMGTVMADYDSVVVRARSNVSYTFDPIVYVAGSGKVDVTEGLDGSFDNIELLSGAKGTLFGLDYECEPNIVSTDTLLYTYNDGGCDMTATRLVNVISSKSIAIRVLLEGAYLSKADSMRCVYEGNFPGSLVDYSSPYVDKKVCVKPFPKFDRKVCDWIYIEAWDYPPFGMNTVDTKRGKLIDSTSALLLSDGTVAGIDGKRYISLDKLPEDSYYIIVKHRNHLPVMSAEKVKFAVGVVPTAANTIDFTQKMENAFDNAGSASSQTPLKGINGKCFMYTGDTDGDGIITTADFISIINGLMVTGYRKTDVNLDGQVNVSDQLMVRVNNSIYKKF